jgi:hypothetical protein
VMRAISARVEGYSVVLELSDGTSVERDFSLVRGGELDRIHRRDGLGLDRRVRIKHGALVWPGEIDFGLDTILWGWPRPRGGRPLRRAIVGCRGTIAPAPIVRSLAHRQRKRR